MDLTTGSVKKQDRVCSGILNRSHPKLKQAKSDVRACADIDHLMKWLPEYPWTQGVLLCASCRSWASRQANDAEKRQVTGAVVDKVVDFIKGKLQKPPPELDIYRGTSTVDEAKPGPSSKVMILSQPEDIAGAESSLQRAMPIFLTASEKQLMPEPSCNIAARIPPRITGFQTPTRGNHGMFGNGRSTEDNLTAEDGLHTPNSNGNAPTLDSEPSSGMPTPSSIATVSSYMAPEIAKEKLRVLLRQIAISPIQGREAQKKSSVSLKYRRFTTAVKGLFKDALGEEVMEPKTCECEHCTLTCKTVKIKIQTAATKTEKYVMLTSLPTFVTVREMIQDYGITQYMATAASSLRVEKGMFSKPDQTLDSERGLDKETVALIKAFYLDDKNSKAVPDLRYTILVKDDDDVYRPKARRNMYANLRDAFEEFKAQNQRAKVKISKFAELRPPNVKWPGARGFHESCTCQLHENCNFMVKGLRAASLSRIEELEETDPDAVPTLALFDYTKELVDFVFCVPPTELCYLGLCGDCPDELYFGKLFKYCEGQDVQYRFWSSADYTTISIAKVPASSFQELFRICLSDFTTHEFIFRKQKAFIHELKVNAINDGSIGVMTVDFGQNYAMTVQNAVQSFHWNNAQATIHPFVLYALDDKNCVTYKTYFMVSEDLGHDASSFHSFRVKVLERVKRDFPRLKKIEYVSDGCPGQYKNYKNIGNLLYHKDDFGLDANWHMTATSHGKSSCDAMCAVVKRTMRLRSLKDKVLITTAETMYAECVRTLTTDKLEFFYSSRDEVQQ